VEDKVIAVVLRIGEKGGGCLCTPLREGCWCCVFHSKNGTIDVWDSWEKQDPKLRTENSSKDRNMMTEEYYEHKNTTCLENMALLKRYFGSKRERMRL